MAGFEFKRAARSQARLRLAIAAVSGGGKTMGALRLAKGLVEHLIAAGVVSGGLEGKIAVIDTERRSASLYADVVPFDTLDLGPPYSVDRYQQAIAAAEAAGYVVLIIDQITHAWAGPGGQLEWVDTLKAQAKNPMSPWMKVTPVQQEFYDRMLRSPMHLIATLRCKSEWVIEDVLVDGRSKKVPRKIGLSPVQREGIEYEFTACLDVDLESHMATASKDRTRLFDGRTTKLDEECGKVLGKWLLSGEAEKPEPAPAQTVVAGSGAPAANPADASNPNVESPFTVQRLESEAADFELSFVECATLPDLAAQFDRAQKRLRAYCEHLGVPAVAAPLGRLVTVKDKRKAALAAAAAGEAGATGAGGAPAAAESAAAPAGSPAATEAAGVKLVGPDDVAALEALCQAVGITEEAGRKACGVERFALLPLAEFARAGDAINAAAKPKDTAAAPIPTKPRRRRAAAGAA